MSSGLLCTVTAGTMDSRPFSWRQHVPHTRHTTIRYHNPISAQRWLAHRCKTPKNKCLVFHACTNITKTIRQSVCNALFHSLVRLVGTKRQDAIKNTSFTHFYNLHCETSSRRTQQTQEMHSRFMQRTWRGTSIIYPSTLKATSPLARKEERRGDFVPESNS